MAQKTSKRSHVANVGAIAAISATLLLVVYFISLLSGFTPFFNTSSEKTALVDLEVTADLADDVLSVHYDNLYAIADRLAFAKDKDEVNEIMESYIGSDLFGDLRYFTQGREYAANGLEVTDTEYEEVRALAERHMQGCSPLYYDNFTTKYCIAFYIPVRGSVYIDGLLSIVEARDKQIALDSALHERSELVAIIDGDGKVLSCFSDEAAGHSIGNNFYDFIKNKTNNGEIRNSVSDAVLSGEPTAITLMLDGTEYTVAARSLDASLGNLSVISMSRSAVLSSEEMTYVRQVIVVSVIAMIALLASILYTFIYHKKTTKTIISSVLVDPELGCPNEEQFKKVAAEILRSSQKKYALLAIELRQFKFITEQLSETEITETLKFISGILNNFTNQGEAFCSQSRGQFLVLYRAKDEDTLKKRILLLGAMVAKAPIPEKKKVSVKLAVGVATTDGLRHRGVSALTDAASSARERARTDLKSTYVLYSERVNNDIIRNEKIESEMEAALTNGDFKLFLQPKYNIERDEIDSAEALVRWYDPKKAAYIFPTEFISLFETNGFVVKLDHYMYIEVLDYVASAIERGDKVVPISVNVSRVTAAQDNFLDFYVSNKLQRMIPDGIITLEFTESFAMEDYAKIASIVDSLHKNGILFSLDDFGSGYSSFNVLKSIDIDEIKLDGFFIAKGSDKRKDDLVLETTVKLAKELGMRVVQERVETADELERVKVIGCDMIQGYYYAKPISLEEFKIFIETNTSIKYKAKVK